MADAAKSTDQRLRDLGEALDAQERETAPPPLPKPAAPSPRPPLSSREKLARRILLGVNMLAAIAVFLLMLASGLSLSPLEWLLGAAIAATCALGLYAIQLFYWHVFKQTAGWVGRRSRKRPSAN